MDNKKPQMFYIRGFYIKLCKYYDYQTLLIHNEDALAE